MEERGYPIRNPETHHEHEREGPSDGDRLERRFPEAAALSVLGRNALHDSEHRAPHPDEDDREKYEVERGDNIAASPHRGVQDQELADERAERGRAGDREEASGEKPGGD